MISIRQTSIVEEIFSIKNKPYWFLSFRECTQTHQKHETLSINCHPKGNLQKNICKNNPSGLITCWVSNGYARKCLSPRKLFLSYPRYQPTLLKTFHDFPAFPPGWEIWEYEYVISFPAKVTCFLTRIAQDTTSSSHKPCAGALAGLASKGMALASSKVAQGARTPVPTLRFLKVLGVLFVKGFKIALVAKI